MKTYLSSDFPALAHRNTRSGYRANPKRFYISCYRGYVKLKVGREIEEEKQPDHRHRDVYQINIEVSI